MFLQTGQNPKRTSSSSSMFTPIFVIFFASQVLFSFVLALPQNQTNHALGGSLKKVHIAIYYESMCPDSEAFISNQLGRNYEKFKNYIDLILVPFGKSESENDGEAFYCQHGPAECSGNRMQSCVLEALGDDQDSKIRFVTCQMSGNSEFSGKKCADEVNVTYSGLLACIRGVKGVNLQLAAEKETHLIAKPYPRFIPTIVYNQTYNATKQRRSLVEFAKVICEELMITLAADQLPSKCAQLSF